MTKRIPLVVVALTFTLLLAGCWDYRGLEGRAFAVMAGVDRTEDNRFRLTLQVQLVKAEQRGGGGGGGGGSDGGGGGGEGGGAYRVLTGEGDTLRMAFEQARGLIARELDEVVLDTIVLGESVADNLEDVRIFIRSLRVPVPSFVAVARGDAEPIVHASTPGIQVPGEYTLQGFRGTWTRSPQVVRAYLWTILLRDYHSPLEDSYAPALTAEKYGLNWDGMAVFRHRSLVGFLSADEASTFNLVENQRFERSVEAQLDSDQKAAMAIQRGKVRKWVTWEGDVPVLHVHVNGGGDVRELTGTKLTNPGAQFKVESALSKALADQIAKLLRRLQEMDVDPVGFGELARRAAPYREEVQTRAAWRSAYQRAQLDIRVSLQAISSGYVE